MNISTIDSNVGSEDDKAVYQSLAIETITHRSAVAARASFSVVSASVAIVIDSADAIRQAAQEVSRMADILSSLHRSLVAGIEKNMLMPMINEAVLTAQSVAKQSWIQAELAADRVCLARTASNAALAAKNAAINSAKLAVQAAKRSAALRAERIEEAKRVAKDVAAAAVAEAESASRLKTAFIANMSHEIRTPIAVIKGFAELLAQENIGTLEHQKWILTVLGASQQLEFLINDMLDISKVEAGKMDIECAPVHLRQVIVDTEVLLRQKAREKGLDLIFAVEGLVPPIVNTDATRLKQILLNIVGNAIKFTDEGQIKVMVKLLDGSKASSQQLAFVVIDNGIGISKEQETRLFQAFGQADSSITRRFGGTGLGLSLSRQLAQLLGGDVVLSRGKGKGCVFTITIDPGPLNPQLFQTDLGLFEPPKQLAYETYSHQSVFSGLRVLLVEDAPDLGALVDRILSSHGAAVRLAINGKEGIQAARSSHFDMILMDIQMPIIDGYEATRQLRLEGFSLPIFALTAHAMKGERERCLAAGFTDYLTKPVNVKKLFDMIRNFRESEWH